MLYFSISMPNENLPFPEPDFNDAGLQAFLNDSAKRDGRAIPFAEQFLKAGKKDEQEETEIPMDFSPPMDSYEDTRGLSSSSSDGVYPDVIEGFENLPGGGRIRKNKL